MELNNECKCYSVADIRKLLPGYHCGACGFIKCDDFAEAVAKGKSVPQKCRFILQEKFKTNLQQINSLMHGELNVEQEVCVGTLDDYVADFLLKPLLDEVACREILFPFYQGRNYEIGELVKYRPLGCPIPHYAKIIDVNKGLITVHVIGPCHRINNTEDTFEDIGVCMVGGFIGLIEGKKPKIGKTVRFIPKSCMMQKVHSGIVVQMEGEKAIIEAVDLKVWSLPEVVV